jgi:hypothetical protein
MKQQIAIKERFLTLLLVLIAAPFSLTAKNGIALPSYFGITSKGYLTGKLPTDEFCLFDNSLNNHGGIYSDLAIFAGADSLNRLVAGARVWASNFSEDQKFAIEPYARIELGKGDSAKSWAAQAGELPRITIGHGLTFSDFRQLGGDAMARIGNFKAGLTYWGQGYATSEDVFRLGVSYRRQMLEFGLNGIFWWIQNVGAQNWFGKDRYYYSLYALPHFELALPWFSFYGEYGFKRIISKNTASLIDETEPVSHGVVAGLHFADTLFGIAVQANPEFRHYSRGFIPVTGVDANRLESMDHIYYRQNNWIDFFDSREKSTWWYFFASAESPRFRNFSIFAYAPDLFIAKHV